MKSLINLKSLFINLHEEEQVDFIMRTLEGLEFLNGLKVERDILEEDDEDYNDEVDKSPDKNISPVQED